MNKIRTFFANRWVKFSIAALIYTLWFVIWSEIWWAIFGLPLIYDYYISKYYRKLFWNKHLEIKSKNRAYKEVMGWVEAILFAVIVASTLRMYFIEMYVIPTSSMEKTLLIGDYLGVNKFYYGTKMPNTPIGIPLVHNVNPLNPALKSYSELIQNPYRRLKGLGSVKRYDVVVFNYPEGDTVATLAPQNNYYQLVRNYGRKTLLEQSDIMTHPVDKRDNYIKRNIALPGDTFEVRDGVVYSNGEREPKRDGIQYTYKVELNGKGLSKNTLEDMGISMDDVSFGNDNKSITTLLTDINVEKLKAEAGVDDVIRIYQDRVEEDIFPHDTANYPWSVDNFGPLTVPKKGESVAINKTTLPLYERIISVYEGNDLEVKDDEIFINGKKSDNYTFKMDYFFMMGDNRHNSLDSRFWGFVPEDHIVGKASFVWLSLDKNKSFPKNIRFGRMFRGIE